MTAKKPASLAATLTDNAAAKVAEIEKKAANTARLAAAYDASGYAGPLPYIASGDARASYDGTIASLHFRDVAPDELAALLVAFPAIPRAEFKHRGSRSFRPGEVPEDAEEVRECDGVEIDVTGGKGFDTFRASWSAMVGDVNTRFWCDLRRVQFLSPRTHRRAVTMNHTFIRYEGATSLHWPDNGALFNDVAPDAGLFVRMYGSGSDQSHGDARIRGRDVLALVRAWEAECNRRGEVTRAAFLAAYADAEALGLPSADDIAAAAEAMRAEYDAKRGGLRAGTLEQTAALATPHALADKAVAEKHWPPYAERFGIETRQSYFEHYAWACEWLKRCGMYAVPVTDAMRAEAKGGIDGDVYRYGHRWL